MKLLDLLIPILLLVLGAAFLFGEQVAGALLLAIGGFWLCAWIIKNVAPVKDEKAKR